MAERIKGLEARFESTLNANEPYVLRLDGVAFRTFTEGMQKPFDGRLTMAMLLTTHDLMDRCAARTAFCQSDEISLVFAAEPTPSQIIYSGRTLKIASVMAAAATARFNYHIARMPWDPPSDNADPYRPVAAHVRERMQASVALFDARVFSVPDEIIAMEALYWRHAYDGRRNAINMVAHAHFPADQLQGLPLTEVMRRLRTEAKTDPFKEYSPEMIYGAFLKRIQYPHAGLNPLTGQIVPTIRTRVEARSFDWIQAPLDRTRMVMARYWEPQDPASLKTLPLTSNP